MHYVQTLILWLNTTDLKLGNGHVRQLKALLPYSDEYIQRNNAMWYC